MTVGKGFGLGLGCVVIAAAAHVIALGPGLATAMFAPGEICRIALCAGVGAAALGIWAIGAGLIANCFPNLLRRRGAVILFPTVLVLLVAVGRLILSPPSPSNYFAFWFGAPIPASAEVIRISVPPPNDPGSVGIYFSCSPEDADRLIAETQMNPFEPEDEFFFPFEMFGVAEANDWQGRSIYVSNEPRGVVSAAILVCVDQTREKVAVVRYPLWFKDNEI